ncbi:MAG: helix-turn-helix transcriptional regulator [Eubacterium sp.]|nr:helix-turn-helix transcriptional regulator [Eubacterium sp.]
MNYERIRNLREDHDLTQTEIARILHIEQRTYSHYERGDRLWKPELLATLALYYHTSIDYLLDLTDEKKPYPQKRNGQGMIYNSSFENGKVAESSKYKADNRKN